MNGRSVPYPSHLKENMLLTCPKSWVVDKVKEYVAFGHYLHVEEYALNIGIGCKNLVSIFSSCTFLTSYYTYEL